MLKGLMNSDIHADLKKSMEMACIACDGILHRWLCV